MTTPINIDSRVLERGEARLAGKRTGDMMNSAFGEIKGKALDGQAIKYNVPFPYKESIVMFEPGSFGNLASTEIGFQVDHNLASRVASTKNALKVSSGGDGIFFRLDLSKAKNGHILARMCDTGSRAATSIGCRILKEREQVIAGHKVRVIEKARLEEISICAQGSAGDNAFACVVDKAVTPDPTLGSRSVIFNAHHQIHKLNRKVRDLKERVAAMRDAPVREVARSITVDMMNYWQTEETERLQSMASGRW